MIYDGKYRCFVEAKDPISLRLNGTTQRIELGRLSRWKNQFNPGVVSRFHFLYRFSGGKPPCAANSFACASIFTGLCLTFVLAGCALR